MAAKDAQAQGHQLLYLALGRVGGRRDGAACHIMQQGGQRSRSRGIGLLTANAVKLKGCVFWLYLFDVFHIIWIWDGVPPIGYGTATPIGFYL